MNPECERFEVEIGMHQHGALDAREEAVLKAHLATCPSCRQFAAAGGDLETALQRRAELDVAAVDWSALHRGVGRLQRSYRRKIWLAPLFVFQIPLVFLLGLGHLPPQQLLAAAPATVGIYLVYLWLLNRPFREVMAVVKNGDDLLLGYTRELRRQLWRARAFVGVNLALALGCLVAAWAEPGARLRLLGLGCALLFGGFVAYDLGVKLPRLRRALAESGR